MTRFSVSIPPFGTFGDPHVMVDLAVTAERAGWHGFFIWDHIQLGPWAGPVVDPWITLAAAAAATERIRIGPMVTPLPRRRPSKLARETVTLDHLSGGRLVLGVGIGWPPAEDFGAFGDAEDNAVRAAQLDEGLEVLTSLWSGATLEHRGEHYTAVNARFLPTPIQEPRIPIWVGGMWPHRGAFRRAARWDGVVPIAVDEGYEMADLDPATFAEIVAYVRERREDDLPFDAVASGMLLDDPVRAPEVLGAFEEAGMTWWMENIGWPPGLPVDHWRDLIGAGPPR